MLSETQKGKGQLDRILWLSKCMRRDLKKMGISSKTSLKSSPSSRWTRVPIPFAENEKNVPSDMKAASQQVNIDDRPWAEKRTEQQKSPLKPGVSTTLSPTNLSMWCSGSSRSLHGGVLLWDSDLRTRQEGNDFDTKDLLSGSRSGNEFFYRNSASASTDAWLHPQVLPNKQVATINKVKITRGNKLFVKHKRQFLSANNCNANNASTFFQVGIQGDNSGCGKTPAYIVLKTAL